MFAISDVMADLGCYKAYFLDASLYSFDGLRFEVFDSYHELRFEQFDILDALLDSADFLVKGTGYYASDYLCYVDRWRGRLAKESWFRLAE